MPPLDLFDAADDLAKMIATAREALSKGHGVDLSPIETHVTAIYSEVSSSAFTPQVDRSTLLARLNILLPQLNALEADLTAANQTAGN